MKWTAGLLLGFIAAAGPCAVRMHAQYVIEPAKSYYVVPAAKYEPAHPQAQTPKEAAAKVVPARSYQVVPAAAYEPAHPQDSVRPAAGIAATTSVNVVPAAVYVPAHPQAPIQAGDAAAVDGDREPAIDFKKPARDDGYSVWARADYLLWWMSRAPVPVPLITTNSPPNIGALSEPGTTVLYGAGSSQNTNFGLFSGGRATIGGWLESGYEFAWELTGFWLQTRNQSFSASSPGGAAPVVSIPFYATEPFGQNAAGETSLNSGGAPATAAVRLNSQLWGLELNEIVIAGGTKEAFWAIVIGGRYLDLTENLTLNYTTLDTATSGAVAVTDGFGTRNQFFAGQFGARAAWSLGDITINASAMLGLGDMAETNHIAGATTVTNGAFGFANGTTPGGVFAEPSNIGLARRNLFAFVPEMTFKISWSLTPGIQPFLGYDAMWLSNVARPGNQIDRNINPTQNAFFNPPGTLTGPTSPLPIVHGADMWVQGMQVGVEIRY